MPDNKLDGLPDYIKSVLHSLISMGHGSFTIKKQLEAKFGTFQDILPAARQTYENYILLHKNDIIADRDKSAQAISSVEEVVQNIIGEGSLKDQTENLEAFVQDRIEFLKKQQAIGIPSANIENTISQYAKTLSTLIEKKFQYREELNKDHKAEVKKFFLFCLRKIISEIIRIYKKYHGEIKFLEFITDVNEAFNRVLKEQFEFDEQTQTPLPLDRKEIGTENPNTQA